MEDVGCDQCGGLWFNPFLEIFDNLKGISKLLTQKSDRHRCSSSVSEDVRSFDMWSCDHPFSSTLLEKASTIETPSSRTNLKTTENPQSSGKSKQIYFVKSEASGKSKSQGFEKAATCEKSESGGPEKTATSDTDKSDMLLGATKFYNMVKSARLEKMHYVTVEGEKYSLGPDLWDHFLPPPAIEVSDEPVSFFLKTVQCRTDLS